jgi:hypothetical protein
MAVYVLALNPGRKMLFKWKCLNVAEARCIVRNMSTIFGHCLSNISLSHRLDDDILFRKGTYDKVKHFTFETHPSYYLRRDL